jgi:hypothetical protein
MRGSNGRRPTCAAEADTDTEGASYFTYPTLKNAQITHQLPGRQVRPGGPSKLWRDLAGK